MAHYSLANKMTFIVIISFFFFFWVEYWLGKILTQIYYINICV